jgi:predicted DNA-binding transcriptional regulator AlpA
MTVKERLEAAKQKDFITVEECALLVGVSERTIWRRLKQMDRVVRDGRIVRLHRITAVRFFLKF